mgnify:CR=1 FL=1
MAIIQSFNRFESKYLLTEEQKERFVSAVGEHLVKDKYDKYTICNIYLDTDDFRFIEHSLDKPIYKEKLRIRSYGTANDNSMVFFEIKKKFRKIVYKRRIIIPFCEAADYIESGIRPPSLYGYTENQIFNEIDYLMKKYKPVPKLFLAYDRVAYSDNRFSGFRVTFDKDIRGRWDDLTLRRDENNELLDTEIENYNVMELKCEGAMPLYYVNLLRELGIHQISFSKYGRIYVNSFNKGERKLCYE